MRRFKRLRKRSLALAVVFLVAAGNMVVQHFYPEQGIVSTTLGEIPEYAGNPYVILNDNQPDFTEEEMQSGAYEFYSEMDAYGRCGAAEAMIGEEIMPTEERGSIGQVKPSGWHTVKYDIVDGKYLYNRCHLIGYQLAGEKSVGIWRTDGGKICGR